MNMSFFVFPVLAGVTIIFLWKKGLLPNKTVRLLLIVLIPLVLLSGKEYMEEDQSPISEIEKSRTEGSVISLEVETEDGSLHELNLDLDNLGYNRESLQVLLDRTSVLLDEQILGENRSFEQIEYDLLLPSRVEETGVTVSWTSDHPEYLRWDGTLEIGIPEKGVDLILTGKLSVQQVTEEYQRSLRIFPSREETALLREITSETKKINEENAGETLYLPGEVGGKALTWYQTRETTGGLLCLLLILISLLAAWSEQKKKEDKKEEYRKLLQRQYPELVSKLQLLMAAGLSLRKCVDRLARDYPEMEHCRSELESGVNSQDAYMHLGERCGTPEYRKLALLFVQSEKRGGQQLAIQLEQERQTAFEDRKRNARAEGEKSTIRMILPMGMMLVVVLVLIMVPAIMSF